MGFIPGGRRSPMANLVERPVLVDEAPLAVDGYGREIIVGIDHAVIGRPVADFEIDDVLIRFVNEVMRVAASPLEAGAHAGTERCAAGVGDKGRPSVEDIDELVLLCMSMAQSRGPAGLEPRQ